MTILKIRKIRSPRQSAHDLPHVMGRKIGKCHLPFRRDFNFAEFVFVWPGYGDCGFMTPLMEQA